jgi:Ala-tRNA(Pro) deacylase
MTISTRLDRYFNEHDIAYQALAHFPSNNSISSAITANIPLKQIAKTVLLTDHQDRKMMAVLPANNKISLSALNEELQGSYQLVKEKEVYQMFADCEHGAVPPVGAAYNMAMVCDEQLDKLDEVYIEAGDHKTLLCIDHQSFESMMTNVKHLRFSHEVFH